MYAAALAAIILWTATIVAANADENFKFMKFYRTNVRSNQLVRLAENLQQYYVEKGTYPASLAAFAATPGYEHVQSLINNWQGYAVSGSLSDTQWQYYRMAVFSNDPTTGTTATSYLATNYCGTGAFAAASSWCGSPSSLWYRYDTREGYNAQVDTQRARLKRTIEKIADYYTRHQSFPNLDQTSTAMVSGTTYKLATLAGYAGTASACTGNYLWKGIPIDCQDMFDQWGNTTGYAYLTNNHIALTSESPLTNASGTPLLIATDFNM